MYLAKTIVCHDPIIELFVYINIKLTRKVNAHFSRQLRIHFDPGLHRPPDTRCFSRPQPQSSPSIVEPVQFRTWLQTEKKIEKKIDKTFFRVGPARVGHLFALHYHNLIQ